MRTNRITAICALLAACSGGGFTEGTGGPASGGSAGTHGSAGAGGVSGSAGTGAAAGTVSTGGSAALAGSAGSAGTSAGAAGTVTADGSAGAPGGTSAGGSAGTVSTGGSSGQGGEPADAGPDVDPDAPPPCQPDEVIPVLTDTLTWNFSAKYGAQCAVCVDSPCAVCSVTWHPIRLYGGEWWTIASDSVTCPVAPALRGTCYAEDQPCQLGIIAEAHYTFSLDPVPGGYRVRAFDNDSWAGASWDPATDTCGLDAWNTGPAPFGIPVPKIHGATWLCP